MGELNKVLCLSRTINFWINGSLMYKHTRGGKESLSLSLSVAHLKSLELAPTFLVFAYSLYRSLKSVLDTEHCAFKEILCFPWFLSR